MSSLQTTTAIITGTPTSMTSFPSVSTTLETFPTSSLATFSTTALTIGMSITSSSFSTSSSSILPQTTTSPSILGDESFVKIDIPNSPEGSIKVSWWNGTNPFILSLFVSNTTVNMNSDKPFAKFNTTENTYSLPGCLIPAYRYLGASVRDSSNVYHDIQYHQSSLVVCSLASGDMNTNNNNNNSATSSPTHGLSSSAIKGLIIGVIALVVVLVILSLVILSRFKRKNRKEPREPMPRVALYRTLGRPSSRSTSITSRSNFSVSTPDRRSVKDDDDFASEKTPSTIESTVTSEMGMEDIIERHRLQSRPNSKSQLAAPSHARHSSVGWDSSRPQPTSPVSELSPFDDSHSVSTVRPSRAASRRTLSQRTVDRTIAAALQSSEKGRHNTEAVDDAISHLTRSSSDGSALPLSRQELEELADIVAARLNHRINVTTRSIDSRSRSSHGSDLPPRYA